MTLPPLRNSISHHGLIMSLNIFISQKTSFGAGEKRPKQHNKNRKTYTKVPAKSGEKWIYTTFKTPQNTAHKPLPAGNLCK